jgi:hypothetical protein
MHVGVPKILPRFEVVVNKHTKSTAVPLHAMVARGGRGITPPHS